MPSRKKTSSENISTLSQTMLLQAYCCSQGNIKKGQDEITADTAFLCYLERVAAELSLTKY